MGIGQCISFDDLHFPSSQSANMCGCGVKLLRTREGGESRRGTGAEDTYAGGDVVVVSRTLVGGGGMWCCPSVVEHGRVVFGIGGQVSILEFLKLGV